MYDENVFINCPFDKRYKKLFDAIIFGIIDYGFIARCALEKDDGSVSRANKIFAIIDECRFGIHDLSRVEVSSITQLPRFNMPLEPGTFLGAKHFGSELHKKKSCLILDKEKFRYQKFISDIAGQDIKAHNNNQRLIITLVRDWLRTYSIGSIPSGSVIWLRYENLKKALPQLCKELRLNIKELIFDDYVALVSQWLKSNPQETIPIGI